MSHRAYGRLLFWGMILVGIGFVQRLGPAQREYHKSNAPDDYRVPGYARPVRDLGIKVLVYLKNDLILYVWIDEDGKVEEVFHGTS